MSALRDKLIKNSTLDYTSVLSKSTIFNNKDVIQTDIPAINVALGGSIDSGLTPGLTVLAAPSKHFKTAFSLLMASAYIKKYPDAIILFYDSEFGSPQSYFDSFGIPPESVVHTPITNIEELKFDIMNQLMQIKRGEKVMILVDSVGNLASKKEVVDALKESGAADMTRAKQLKSLFRMITPHLTLKDIPMIVVNHVYMSMEMYSKPTVSGGCLVAGTQVRMSDGTTKSIEDIVVGDMVLSDEGPSIVTHAWNPETLDEGEPECFEVEFEDGYRVICSDHHLFLVDGEWVTASMLASGMDCKSL